MYSQNEAHFFQSHFWNGNQSPFTAEQIVESALALSQLCHEPLKKEDCFDFEAQGSDSIFRHTSPSNNGLGDSGYYSNTSLGEHSFTDCIAWRKSSVPGTTNMTYSRKSTEVYKEEKQTLVEIIARAIMATPTRHATLREIYDFMLQHYESYRQRRQQRSWRNSVRHHLYLYDVFVKTNHKVTYFQEGGSTILLEVRCINNLILDESRPASMDTQTSRHENLFRRQLLH